MFKLLWLVVCTPCYGIRGKGDLSSGKRTENNGSRHSHNSDRRTWLLCGEPFRRAGGGRRRVPRLFFCRERGIQPDRREASEQAVVQRRSLVGEHVRPLHRGVSHLPL